MAIPAFDPTDRASKGAAEKARNIFHNLIWVYDWIRRLGNDATQIDLLAISQLDANARLLETYLEENPLTPDVADALSGLIKFRHKVDWPAADIAADAAALIIEAKAIGAEYAKAVGDQPVTVAVRKWSMTTGSEVAPEAVKVDRSTMPAVSSRIDEVRAKLG